MKLLRLLRCACFGLIALQLVSVSRAGDSLSLDDLIALLQVGSKTEEILPELNKRGYAGATDTEALHKLKQAGADVALLLAVRKAGNAVGAAGTNAETKAPWGSTISLKLSDELSMKMCWVGQLGMYVGQYEVSNQEFDAYGPRSGKNMNMGIDTNRIGRYVDYDESDPRVSGMDTMKIPVATSWIQAMGFCVNLTHDLADQNPQYEGIGRWTVRLPWLSEWEVYKGDAKWQEAISAITIKDHPEGIPGVSIPLPPGTCRANNFDLYDALGNMAEWCLDPWAFDDSDVVKDRVLVGGSFLNKAPDNKGGDFEGYQVDTGFRCVLAASLTTPADSASTPPEAVKKLPDGIPVPGRLGFVNSPYAPKHLLIDVTGLPVGMEVKCPYTGRPFRVPKQ